MTTTTARQVAAPRYSAEDFETISIRSTAPSYQSDTPSYHTTAHYAEEIPPYSPPVSGSAGHGRSVSFAATGQPSTSRQQQQRPHGLPPVSSQLPVGPTLHNFRIPTWSTHNAPAARQYQSVIERRASANKDPYSADGSRRPTWIDKLPENQDKDTSRHEIRPLEDPYLVGEVAAANARRERLARENGDDILIREDKHWDWLIGQMKDWDERDRSWAKFREEVKTGKSKKLMRRIYGGRLH